MKTVLFVTIITIPWQKFCSDFLNLDNSNIISLMIIIWDNHQMYSHQLSLFLLNVAGIIYFPFLLSLIFSTKDYIFTYSRKDVCIHYIHLAVSNSYSETNWITNKKRKKPSIEAIKTISSSTLVLKSLILSQASNLKWKTYRWK